MQASLREIAILFLRLGTIGFGGPAAHVALMEAEVVRQRRWLSHEEFLDLLGATNLIPGPNSTEMALQVGYRRAGVAGLIVAGVCFIFPAAVIVTFMAWTYVRFGALPQLDIVLRSVKPVMIVVVAQALWGLGKSAVKSTQTAAVAIGSVILSLAGVNELLILVTAGLACALVSQARGRRAAMMSVGPLPLFLFFAKVGSVLFGSGYVLLAFLRADLVERWHWLTAGQLLDAVAVGQVTPGPVLTTATFIGYLLAGVPGALSATIGIFLPAFVFAGLSGYLVPRIRKSTVAAAMLDGVNAGSLALMAVVTWQLARAAVVDTATAVLAAAAVFAILALRINATWVVAAAAVAGLLLYGFR